MRTLFILIFLLSLSPSFRVLAQTIDGAPLCLTIFNSAKHEILGSLQTDQVTDALGNISYHDFVFRLQAGESREACSTGPFFEGQQLRLVLKTSFPVYSCKVTMGQKITIESHLDDQGERVITADCPSERDQLLAAPAK